MKISVPKTYIQCILVNGALELQSVHAMFNTIGCSVLH